MFDNFWHKLPTPLALLQLLKLRNDLREKNLHDTSQLPDSGELPKPHPSSDGSHLTARTVDGSFNDLQQPQMGMAGTRFGRNVALGAVEAEAAPKLMTPNPREVSRILMTRDRFQPATILNLLAAAWIQFENHDWFSHGDNEPDDKLEIPLEPNDPWPEEHRPMAVGKTLADKSRPDGARPKTFINTVTHWWDGSQIYGSDPETVDKLRSHVHGKLTIQDDGLLPVDPETGLDVTGFNDNWWIGLSMLHTVFTKEHNAICDHLKQEYSHWSDDVLFNHARLINAALMAKIHTVEWTPAILPLPATDIALNVNWSGFLGEDLKQVLGSVGEGELTDLLSGIVGAETDHHTAPYYLTEEFASVYRMHPLIPDEFQFYSLDNNRPLQAADFFQISGKRSRTLLESIPMPDLYYSFGIAHPGEISLHNYPRSLQQLVRDNGEVFDLAAVDILRDRERGVPRYNRFRELIGRTRVKSFEEISSNKQWVEEMRRVYYNDINSVDLMVGLFAEDKPEGFGFSDTAFRVFILMASRRLKSDRFFTKDYRAEVYTQLGLDWIANNTMVTVLQRHFPTLAPALYDIDNAFKPWRRIGT
ncbi:peroxidase family protein [Adonisia turfae]|uniref:Peroxidase n=1 Tax=Adonisia turfae CCMR0081 TaxID=2292702 RepID=A0A6M0RGW3_9CYAN|nr:peroxidase family protein [Adonisia turfae]NEZ55486.1 peroxidase [Adonisia turfae CCMR0081]